MDDNDHRNHSNFIFVRTDEIFKTTFPRKFKFIYTFNFIRGLRISNLTATDASLREGLAVGVVA